MQQGHWQVGNIRILVCAQQAQEIYRYICTFFMNLVSPSETTIIMGLHKSSWNRTWDFIETQREQGQKRPTALTVIVIVFAIKRVLVKLSSTNGVEVNLQATHKKCTEPSINGFSVTVWENLATVGAPSRNNVYAKPCGAAGLHRRSGLFLQESTEISVRYSQWPKNMKRWTLREHAINFGRDAKRMGLHLCREVSNSEFEKTGLEMDVPSKQSRICRCRYAVKWGLHWADHNSKVRHLGNQVMSVPYISWALFTVPTMRPAITVPQNKTKVHQALLYVAYTRIQTSAIHWMNASHFQRNRCIPEDANPDKAVTAEKLSTMVRHLRGKYFWVR